MNKITIGLDDATLKRLEERARLHNRSLEAEAREILSSRYVMSPEERTEAARRIRAMTPDVQQTDSVEMLREIRRERDGRNG